MKTYKVEQWKNKKWITLFITNNEIVAAEKFRDLRSKNPFGQFKIVETYDVKK